MWKSVSGIRVISYTHILVKRCDNLLIASYLYTHDLMRTECKATEEKTCPLPPTPTFIATKYEPQYSAIFIHCKFWRPREILYDREFVSFPDNGPLRTETYSNIQCDTEI